MAPLLPQTALPAPLTRLGMSVLLATAGSVAQAAPPPCPFKPEVLKSTFGVAFDAGTEEPGGLGGTSCKYKTVGGSLAKGTDFSLWVIVLPPGPNQSMMRQMTAGGVKVKFEPIAGDPDGATRVRGSAGEEGGLIDVSYQRSGHVVFLRSLGLGHEPDAKAREARNSQFAAKLLKLPRLP